MPGHSGPNTLGESNLVFAYDTGDVENSYKGQPTTNLEASNIDTTFESNIISDTAGFNNQLGTGNYLGVTSAIGYKSSKSLRVNRGTGGTGRIFKTYSVSTGEYSTVSAWVYSTVAGPFLALEYFGGDYNWGVSYTNNVHTGTGWERLFVRTNSSATSNTTGYYFIYPSVENTNIFIDNIQVEKKPYPTSFINGTRSATQGLLPLIGNSTIDLTNASFNSNAQISLDGSNDYVKISQNNNYFTSQWAWELVVKFTANTGTYQGLVWAEGDTGGGSGLQYLLTLYNHTYFHYRISNASTGWANTDTSTINFTPSNNNHIVWQFNNGVTSIYVNGALFHTDSGRGVYNGGTNSPVFIGARNDGAFSSAIQPSVVKQYNRALTAQEVRQNYQQYKTRFNLS